MKKGLNIQRLAYLLIVIFLVVYLLIIGSEIIIPFVFAGFFMFVSYPVCNWFEKKFNRIISIIATFFVVTMPLVAAILLFVGQSIEVFSQLPDLTGRLQDVFINGQNWLNETFDISPGRTQEWFNENLGTILSSPVDAVGSGLISSGTVIASLFLILIYTFLLLLYRSSIRNFFLGQFSKEHREGAGLFIEDIQTVTQKYLYGLSLVMLILGVLNSFGLYFIGIEYAFFWGFLAAFLAIIPYIGTFLGGLMPFLYALVTTDTTWQPIAVAILFTVIQSIEGNLITPKIVGSSVKVNPLAAILSLLIGASIWGVAGLIVALPFIAILRVIFDRIDFLRPVSVLLSDDLMEKRDVFLNEFDHNRYRLASFLYGSRLDALSSQLRKPVVPPAKRIPDRKKQTGGQGKPKGNIKKPPPAE